MLERLFNTRQIADLLGANEAAVVDWIKKGWLPVRDMPGEQVRISEKGLVQFLRNRGIDMEAIIAGVASDASGEQLPETVSPSPRVISPEESRPLSPEEPPREGRPQGTLAPEETFASQRDRVLPVAVTEEIEHSESHQADPADQVADAVLRDAVTKRVSHIHLDSCRDELSLRVRIDGLLHDKPNFKSHLPKGLGPRLVAHLKNLAGLEVTEVARPQAGSFRHDINGVQEDFHLATHPTVHGERLVICVPPRVKDAPALDGIGLGEYDLSSLRAMLDEPCGLILVAGLPGSGRATTLRAMLAEVNTTDKDVVALESRSEFPLEGVSRCRVNGEKGFTTVADVLRSARDQDVDVILIDDIPDRAAAVGAIEAVIDGKLVLAGVFAAGNSAVAMQMMLESAQSWTLASALLTVINLRTVRKICPKCRKMVTEPTFSGISPAERLSEVKHCLRHHVLYRGAGCDECSQTGYAGRTGLFSLLHIDGHVAAMLRNGADAGQIISSAEEAGMDTLYHAGLKKVRDGITSLEELSRVFPHIPE